MKTMGVHNHQPIGRIFFPSAVLHIRGARLHSIPCGLATGRQPALEQWGLGATSATQGKVCYVLTPIRNHSGLCHSNKRCDCVEDLLASLQIYTSEIMIFLV
jgi:hypothetical protein